MGLCESNNLRFCIAIFFLTNKQKKFERGSTIMTLYELCDRTLCFDYFIIFFTIFCLNLKHLNFVLTAFFFFTCSLRYRKMKERLGLTEIRKHANRMTFAEVS